MGTVLKGGTLVEFEPARVEAADLRIEGGSIVERGAALTPIAGDDVVDVRGKLVLPGLVCGHHHLYTSLLRGMPGTFAPMEYAQAVAGGPRRLAPHLDLGSVQLSAAVGGLEAMGCGTTTIVDHHASPSAVQGSLFRVARGLNDVGLRGILSYEISDLDGPQVVAAALEETRAFLGRACGRFRGMVGGDACSSLSNATLEALAALVGATGAAFHLHLAEDPLDERGSREAYGEAPVARLMAAGLLRPTSVLAHAVHLSWPELSEVISTGAWLVHLPQSNMHRQVGHAPAGKFGARALLGTDGMGADLWQELRLAHFRAREAGQPIDPLRYLANGHRLASQVFGQTFGALDAGGVADLQVMDYRSPTALRAETLASHVLQGLSARWVEHVMVDGTWRLWARRPLSVNADTVYAQAREAAAELWSKTTAASVA